MIVDIADADGDFFRTSLYDDERNTDEEPHVVIVHQYFEVQPTFDEIVNGDDRVFGFEKKSGEYIFGRAIPDANSKKVICLEILDDDDSPTDEIFKIRCKESESRLCVQRVVRDVIPEGIQ